MQQSARWLLIAVLIAGVGESRAAAEELSPPDPEWEWEVGEDELPATESAGDALPLLAAAPPTGEPAPAQAGAAPSAVPAEPIVPPPPSAAEPPAVQPASPEPELAPPAPTGPPPEPSPAEPAPTPDPAFDDWGAPGSDYIPTEPKIQAAIMLGVGASFDDTLGSVNPYGFGFGLRGSYRFIPEVPELAVGGRFLYYVGGSSPLPTGEIAMSTWILAAEAAYVLPVVGMYLEPGLAIGLSGRGIDGRTPFVDGQSGFVPGSDSRAEVGFYLAPGLAVCLPLSLMDPSLEQFFIGADARLGMVFGHGVSGSLELMAQGGLRF